MRRARFRAPKSWPVAHYHVVSRVVDRRFVLNELEREQFVAYLRLYERFCGVRVLTYCVLSNHFHLLLEVPRPPTEGVGESDLIDIVRRSYGSERARALGAEIEQVRSQAGEEAALALIARWTSRMCDISQFMKTLKQRFTQWFNKRHQRRGTLWEERFRSTLIEGTPEALLCVAAYIDLNPVRAGLVDDPKDYRRCGYGEAMAGGSDARRGLGRLLEAHASASDPLAVLAAYRVHLFGVGGAPQGIGPEGQPLRQQFDPALVAAVLKAGGRLSTAEFLRCRVRYFSDGVAIGGRAFIQALFEAARERFSSARRDGPRRVRSLQLPLYTLRQLRLDTILPPSGTA